MSELEREYFKWICKVISYKRSKVVKDHERLLMQLYETPFKVIIPMDSNRYDNGIDLRYRFGYMNHIPDAVIATELDDKQCSILEMMVDLCIQIEEGIMNDWDLGDRTASWFWEMIRNLGLMDITNKKYDELYVEKILQKFNDRKYAANGKGGLFTLNKPSVDLRNVEIWTQAMWFLDEVLGR